MVGRKVLVVDDESALLRGLGRVLGARGYDIRTANSVDAAMAILEQEPVDAVLSDFRLGDGADGLDVLGRTAERHPEATRLLMTGGEITPRIRGAIGVQADRVLRKPVDYALLERLLGNPHDDSGEGDVRQA